MNVEIRRLHPGDDALVMRSANLLPRGGDVAKGDRRSRRARGASIILRGQKGVGALHETPPSGLPAISPSRREKRYRAGFRRSPTMPGSDETIPYPCACLASEAGASTSRRSAQPSSQSRLCISTRREAVRSNSNISVPRLAV